MRPVLLLTLALACPTAVYAADATASLTIHNRAFDPGQIEVPANQRIELHVKNADAGPSEFESETLHREKIVPAGQEVVVYVGPLKPGSYEFFDDFNPKARGHIVAK